MNQVGDGAREHSKPRNKDSEEKKNHTKCRDHTTGTRPLNRHRFRNVGLRRASPVKDPPSDDKAVVSKNLRNKASFCRPLHQSVCCLMVPWEGRSAIRRRLALSCAVIVRDPSKRSVKNPLETVQHAEPECLVWFEANHKQEEP
ncbi:hypothetical protein YC2023_066689 [Brassica napus]